MGPTVGVTQDMTIERAIAEALGHLKLEPMVRDKLVAVKPNETWASPEDTTGVTQANTLRAVLREIKRFGPRGLGETDPEKMAFPALSMKEAIERFTEKAYGERLTFEHA